MGDPQQPTVGGRLTPTVVPGAPNPSAWNLPNALTVGRILLVPVVGALLLADEGRNAATRWLALGAFIVAAVTDKIDGDLARKRGQVTNFGKIADPIADKALLGMVFVGLSLLTLVPWWVTVLVLARELAITVMRFVVIRHGVMPAGRGGKVKTMIQALALGMLILPAWVLPFADGWRLAAYLVLALAVAITVGTGLDYVMQAHRLRRTSPRAVAKRAEREARRRARLDGSAR
ncbi:MAG: CDP-diacylglycerol--glycerol-3-phosphate 3-phosphatidyltransferase [Dermatophilaceae bacterium]|jgi:CDP-diacylglycerol--glycerol-3-phosphate 3-phosphatidyltransferase|nr:CDP-diacylglycerol--glycerol-3-phosphate 3-phosphatidyltransferase [Actinomycetales bacterium]MBP8881051.1 CDP-diacylglycerol--glycerol-3-phosphate 3-phosphatidyltransferase [Dermatophilaceae bacterium]MBP9918445.1 CDP-diacylglycerol--glycerol-3-phosphate 3-phosphatidyltransferase [Dermatophilaceae bacterium]